MSPSPPPTITKRHFVSTSRLLLVFFVATITLSAAQSVASAKQFAIDSFQRGQNLPSQGAYYGPLPNQVGGAPSERMMTGGPVPQDGNARDYSGILTAMKRHMSMLRLRRANRELRSFGGGSPMNRMTMLRLRRYRQPSMLRLKRVTQMRLKKDQEDAVDSSPPYGYSEYDYQDQPAA